MKNIGLILFAVAMLGLTETPVSAAVSTATATTETTVKAREETIFKRKRKGYHKKKGFLWGLFKKNDCGCPRH